MPHLGPEQGLGRIRDSQTISWGGRRGEADGKGGWQPSHSPLSIHDLVYLSLDLSTYFLMRDLVSKDCLQEGSVTAHFHPSLVLAKRKLRCCVAD